MIEQPTKITTVAKTRILRHLPQKKSTSHLYQTSIVAITDSNAGELVVGIEFR